MLVVMKNLNNNVKKYFEMFSGGFDRPLVLKLRYFFPWLYSVTLSKGPASDGMPWMPFEAIQYLKSLCHKSAQVFEFGSGGSSLFFLSRVDKLFSVEHDETWFQQVSSMVNATDDYHRWVGMLAPPVWFKEKSYTSPIHLSTDASLQNYSFEEYCSKIDSFPNDYFDLILIDGRSRVGCFIHSYAKVKVGGFIILDNSERAEYLQIFDIASKLGFEKIEFYGPGPYIDYQWGSTFFQRKHKDYSLYEIERNLARYLSINNGFFIEAGGFDGVIQSNTLNLELEKNWRGLLVEAVPELFNQCKINRIHCVVENFTLVSFAEMEKLKGQNTQFKNLKFAGLMSAVKDENNALDAEEHAALGCSIQNLNSYEVVSAAITLSGLLDLRGIHKNIDFLSLDVEGYELEVLRGIDFVRHAPTYILVETKKFDDVLKILGDRYDYLDQFSHHDYFFGLKSK